MKTKNKSQESLIDLQTNLQFTEVRFERILVAINSSNLESPVFEKAILMAQENNSRLMLFYCLDLSLSQRASLLTGIFSSEMVDYSEQLHPYLTDDVLKGLRSRHKQAQELGIPTEFDYTLGEPSQAICQLGKSWGADLIILEEQKHSGLAKLFLQSVSDYVVSHADSSVITVNSY